MILKGTLSPPGESIDFQGNHWFKWKSYLLSSLFFPPSFLFFPCLPFAFCVIRLCFPLSSCFAFRMQRKCQTNYGGQTFVTQNQPKTPRQTLPNIIWETKAILTKLSFATYVHLRRRRSKSCCALVLPMGLLVFCLRLFGSIFLFTDGLHSSRWARKQALRSPKRPAAFVLLNQISD